MQLIRQRTVKEPPTTPDEIKTTSFPHQTAIMFHFGWLILQSLMCVYIYLDSVLAAQLLCIKSRAVDCVEGQFSSSREERGGFREELLILCLHGDCFDKHGVTGVFVGFQFCSVREVIGVLVKNL